MPIPVFIDKKVLKRLYSEEKRGSYEIARILDCSASLIRKRLKEYNIRSRSVQEAKALTKPKYPRKNFSGNLHEKAYLIGFRLGDLHVRKTHPNSPTIQISVNTTKKEQLDLVEKLFSKYGYVKQYPRDKNGAISIRSFVNTSFSFLQKKEDAVENWILKNNNYFLSFLAGYADAEGTFCICGGDGVFSIKSQDKNILWAIYRYLRKSDILCKEPNLFALANTVTKSGFRNNKDAWILTVYRKDSLLKLIGLLKSKLQHKKRYKDMLLVKKNIEARNLKYNNMPDRRWYKTY